ncbi:MAG: HYR domain-containing protein, partial [Desulfobacteraceae bacterium]|nr:HYR domain-containing protein [Desulfobacteraceae bacterium]
IVDIPGLVIQDPTEGTQLPVGENTITLNTIDGSGNSSACTVTVTVNDTEAPVAVCPATIADVSLDASGNGTLPANIGDGSSTDNCDSPPTETSPSQSYTCDDLGEQSVTLTATDGSDNDHTTTCTFTVVDIIDPVAVCPATIADVSLDASGNGTLPANIGDGSSTDNCDSPPTETSPSQSYTCDDLGEQSVILTATDGSDNDHTTTCTFTVVDIIDPVAVCPATIADVSLDADGNGTLAANIGDGSSTDNCDSPPTETSPSQSYTCDDLGEQSVPLTATDGSDNDHT